MSTDVELFNFPIPTFMLILKSHYDYPIIDDNKYNHEENLSLKA